MRVLRQAGRVNGRWPSQARFRPPADAPARISPSRPQARRKRAMSSPCPNRGRANLARASASSQPTGLAPGRRRGLPQQARRRRAMDRRGRRSSAMGRNSPCQRPRSPRQEIRSPTFRQRWTNCGRRPSRRRRNAFPRHAFPREPRERCVSATGKSASSPLGGTAARPDAPRERLGGRRGLPGIRSCCTLA